ncbi:hypothetical protein Dimus_025228, partial [Dionaea muscipula]
MLDVEAALGCLPNYNAARLGLRSAHKRGAGRDGLHGRARSPLAEPVAHVTTPIRTTWRGADRRRWAREMMPARRSLVVRLRRSRGRLLATDVAARMKAAGRKPQLAASLGWPQTMPGHARGHPHGASWPRDFLAHFSKG